MLKSEQLLLKIEDLKKVYEVEQGSEHLFHCRVEKKVFDGETGKRMSKPYIQTFGVKQFKTFGKSSLEAQGYTVEVLHDPTEFLKDKAQADKEREDAIRKEAKAEAEAKAKYEAEQKAKEKADKKAKAQAEAEK